MITTDILEDIYFECEQAYRDVLEHLGEKEELLYRQILAEDEKELLQILNEDDE